MLATLYPEDVDGRLLWNVDACYQHTRRHVPENVFTLLETSISNSRLQHAVLHSVFTGLRASVQLQ